jgi:hypothetical protein
MKAKNLDKKLSLNKETITNLDIRELNEARGGIRTCLPGCYTYATDEFNTCMPGCSYYCSTEFPEC